ncbi:Hypothetical predicted protein [Pelobates cultripes]|uniref:Reverse transcriptase zinc-binding domain-containing protein n=1 Tax=Pelobates cultripes TaxID=61616 RepID=A0AAD1VYY2_PELCU|nr:Hypothetical predicted protein [Pelobates cultripes]
MTAKPYLTLQNTPDGTYLQLSTLLEGHRIRPLSNLTRLDTHTPMQYFLYAQVTHFIRDNPILYRGARALSNFKVHCKTSNVKTKLLSTFYKLRGLEAATALPPFTDSWAKDLNTQITNPQWNTIFRQTHATSICTAIQEGNYKRIARWHYSPSKIHSLFPNTHDICWKCTQRGASLAHTWWTCPLLQKYWNNIVKMLKTITGIQVPITPQALLFLILPSPLPKSHHILLTHLITAANLLIPVKWKNPNAPSIREWIAKVETIRTMEEIHGSIAHKLSLFQDVWDPWVRFIKDTQAINDK